MSGKDMANTTSNAGNQIIEPDILNLFDKRNQPALFGEGALLNKAG